MNLLPFGELPAYAPRRFVPGQIDLGDWARLAPLFDQLETRAAACGTVAEFERWLLDWSELRSVLAEEAARRYIAMTCHTDDAEVEKAYLHFVENIEPQLSRPAKTTTVSANHSSAGAVRLRDSRNGFRGIDLAI